MRGNLPIKFRITRIRIGRNEIKTSCIWENQWEIDGGFTEKW